MELSEFVRATLVDVVKGACEAQEEVRAQKAIVNPETSMHVQFEQIEFDVAVTAVQGEGKEAKAGIEVVGLSLGLGAKANTHKEAVSVSRIRFKIPLALPIGRW